MTRYRIYRMKDAPRENFRWAAHTSGIAVVKLNHYESSDEIEAPSPYGAWKRLAVEGRALRPGDLLENIGYGGGPSELQITKYIGFEPAKWFQSEPQPDCATSLTSEPDAIHSNP